MSHLGCPLMREPGCSTVDVVETRSSHVDPVRCGEEVSHPLGSSGVSFTLTRCLSCLLGCLGFLCFLFFALLLQEPLEFSCFGSITH